MTRKRCVAGEKESERECVYVCVCVPVRKHMFTNFYEVWNQKKIVHLLFLFVRLYLFSSTYFSFPYIIPPREEKRKNVRWLISSFKDINYMFGGWFSYVLFRVRSIFVFESVLLKQNVEKKTDTYYISWTMLAVEKAASKVSYGYYAFFSLNRKYNI